MKIIARIYNRLRPRTIINSKINKKSAIGGGSYILNSSIEKYSYCGHNCHIFYASVGSFCSIADEAFIGHGNHPLNWVSTSSAFYKGRESIKKDLASLEFDPSPKRITIDDDVWIGIRAMVKEGVHISVGAVVAMGSVVTHDVPPYAIVAGVPAKVIGYRFDNRIIKKLIESKWWELDESVLKKHSHLMNDPEVFLEAINKNNHR